MGIQGTSTAADCMALLIGSKQKEKQSYDAGGDFSALLAQAMGAQKEMEGSQRADDGLFGFEEIYQKKHIPMTTFSEYVRSPITEQTSWRDSDAYAQFRENFLHPVQLEYTDDMFSYVVDGGDGKELNQKGLEQFHKWRLDTLKPMIPESIEDAERKFQAGHEHLNNYIHTMFEDHGIEMNFVYTPQMGLNGGGLVGALFTADNKPGFNEHRNRYFGYSQTEEAKEMHVMAEEVQFYGAIAKVAKENSAFRRAYESDPEAAIDKYSGMLVRTMSEIKMPEVQTIPDYYR